MKQISLGAIVGFSLCAALFSTRSFADERCQQLEALNVKYAGVQLTPDQKELKIKLVEWYKANCRGHEVAHATTSTTLSAIR